MFLNKIDILLYRLRQRIVSWCNGSTADFGSACQGSNPCETTKKFHKRPIINIDSWSFFVWGETHLPFIFKEAWIRTGNHECLYKLPVLTRD